MLLTRAQIAELADFEADQYIERQDDEGWIFVHDAAHKDEEGSGVWMDTRGQVHHGPMGDARRAAASE